MTTYWNENLKIIAFVVYFKFKVPRSVFELNISASQITADSDWAGGWVSDFQIKAEVQAFLLLDFPVYNMYESLGQIDSRLIINIFKCTEQILMVGQ